MINRESTIGNGKNKALIEKLAESNDHSGTDLSGEQLFCLDLSDKNFSKCDFTNSNLFGSNLSGCNFSNSDLTGAKLINSHIRNCDFTGAKRSGKQIIKHASVWIGDDHHLAFLCKSKDGQLVLINEQCKPEYEFKRGTASQMGSMLYNLLFNN